LRPRGGVINAERRGACGYSLFFMLFALKSLLPSSWLGGSSHINSSSPELNVNNLQVEEFMWNEPPHHEQWRGDNMKNIEYPHVPLLSAFATPLVP
jgi:hypothetical protein